MKYIYPAVFEKENDLYSVYFPDVEGCYTSGEGLEDAINMAEDALSLMLFHMEKKKETEKYPG